MLNPEGRKNLLTWLAGMQADFAVTYFTFRPTLRNEAKKNKRPEGRCVCTY
jgi:hypothetical protein